MFTNGHRGNSKKKYLFITFEVTFGYLVTLVLFEAEADVWMSDDCTQGLAAQILTEPKLLVYIG